MPGTCKRRRASRKQARARGSASRRHIVEAALMHIERGDQVSMRQLAAGLGVTPMALYRHLPSKAVLLDEVVDAVLAKLELPRKRGSWKTRLSALARSFYRLLCQHPRVIPLLSERPALGIGALRLYEAALSILQDSGLDDDGILRSYALLYSYTLGFATIEVGRSNHTQEIPVGDPVLTVAASMHELSREEFPLLKELGPRVGRFTSDQFEFGLRILVAGIETLLHE